MGKNLQQAIPVLAPRWVQLDSQTFRKPGFGRCMLDKASLSRLFSTAVIQKGFFCDIQTIRVATKYQGDMWHLPPPSSSYTQASVTGQLRIRSDLVHMRCEDTVFRQHQRCKNW